MEDDNFHKEIEVLDLDKLQAYWAGTQTEPMWSFVDMHNEFLLETHKFNFKLNDTELLILGWKQREGADTAEYSPFFWTLDVDKLFTKEP